MNKNTLKIETAALAQETLRTHIKKNIFPIDSTVDFNPIGAITNIIFSNSKNSSRLLVVNYGEFIVGSHLLSPMLLGISP